MHSTIAPTRLLAIRHATHYLYETPIRRSVHRVHLRPVHDSHQYVRSYRLAVVPEVPVIEYEDVFGNQAGHFAIERPYTELSIVAESVVELVDVNPFAFASLPIRPSFPLVWMPWERLMLEPYLQPVELPELQLKELYDYAMSFVERNDRDLMETLFAINLTLFREYRYVPGSTDLETTPFQVYTRRIGVCQDFANLFICMARLLGIPARYVCGYIFTGNPAGSGSGSWAGPDASHAWVQLYIPNVGWKGFDPTNGTLPSTDHVRVAYGRHFRDTSPTSGTLFSTGSIRELMQTVVAVEEVARS